MDEPVALPHQVEHGAVWREGIARMKRRKMQIGERQRCQLPQHRRVERLADLVHVVVAEREKLFAAVEAQLLQQRRTERWRHRSLHLHADDGVADASSGLLFDRLQQVARALVLALELTAPRGAEQERLQDLAAGVERVDFVDDQLLETHERTVVAHRNEPREHRRNADEREVRRSGLRVLDHHGDRQRERRDLRALDTRVLP